MLNLRGRLGNQILQLSYYLNKSDNKNLIVNVNSFKLDKIFNDLNIKQIKSPFFDIFFKLLRKIKSIIFNKFSDIEICNFFEGYFQIEHDFNSGLKKYLIKKINKHSAYDIVIHARGEDYLTKKNRKIYVQIDNKYYDLILKKELKLTPRLQICITGNDKRTIENLKHYILLNYPSSNVLIAKGESAWDDFSIIYHAKIAIIPNSTFSYCARLLNPTCKTYCPDKWYLSKKFNRPNNPYFYFVRF